MPIKAREFTTSTPKAKPNNKNRPLVLGEKQWAKIVEDTRKFDEKKNEIDQAKDKEMQQFLKNESQIMTAKWKKSIDNNLNQKQALEDQQREDKLNANDKRYREMQAADPEKRRMLIANAEKLVRKPVQAPLPLKSAAILSEVLKARDLQCEFNRQRRIELKNKQDIQNKEHNVQAIKWIDDYNNKQMDKRKRFDVYKKDLFQICENRHQTKTKDNKQRLAMEQRHIAEHENVQKTRIQNERTTSEQKREFMRRNAVEAILMTEQRRARLKQQQEVCSAMVNMHKENRDEIKKLIKDQNTEEKVQNMLEKQVLQIDAYKVNNQNLAELEVEQEKIEKVAEEKLVIYDEKEKKRMEKIRELKKKRILEHLEEQERRKKEKAVQEDEDRHYCANRIRNDHISNEYTKIKHQRKVDANAIHRKILNLQIDEKKKFTEAELAESQASTRKWDQDEANKEDKHYFNYAVDVLHDAQAKERNTLPIIKSLSKYKKHNFLDIEVFQYPHVISNVPIGDNYQTDPNFSKIKSKKRIKYELEELKMMNPYRRTNHN